MPISRKGNGVTLKVKNMINRAMYMGILIVMDMLLK